MEKKNKYSYRNWAELFSHISYAYEFEYGVDFYEADGLEYINIHKLTLCSDGTAAYKTSLDTFPPELWSKVKLFARLFEEDPVIDILYGRSKED